MDRSRGYLRQSALYQARPDIAAYRSFGWLQALVLLHQQSEISELEAQLLVDVKADRDDEDAGLRELEVNFLAECRERSETRDKLLRVRKMLQVYNQSLLTFNKVYNLPRVKKTAFETLRHWFQMPTGGANFLHYYDALNLEPEVAFDLVRPLWLKKDQDTVSRFTDEKLVPWLDNKVCFARNKPDLKIFDPLSRTMQPEPLHDYSDRFIESTINVLSTGVVYLVTVGPTFALFFVESRAAKILIIAIFALSFCAAMLLLTTATRADHFLALAAFTAVLVVFVSNEPSTASRGD